MDEVERPAIGEGANLGRDIGAHRGERALAERDPVVWAGDEIDGAPHRLRRSQDAGHPPDRRDRRIVRVKRQFHPGRFGDGDDPLHETPQGVPEHIVRYHPIRRRRGVCHQGVIVGRDQRSAPARRRGRRPRPVEPRHPVPADDRHADRSQMTDERLAARDLLLRPLQPQLGRVQPREPGLDHLQNEPRVGEPRLHPQQRQKLPPRPIRSLRRHLRDGMGDPRLPGESPGRIGEWGEVFGEFEHGVRFFLLASSGCQGPT